MKTTVFVVSTCIPERGEKPLWPDVFATEPEAIAHLEKTMREEWDTARPHNPETGEETEYPGDWQAAMQALQEHFSDGSWGSYILTSHDIEIGTELLAKVAQAHYSAGLRSAIGAIHSLQEQIGQMRGMFSDEDGTIEEAMENADETVEEIDALLKGDPAPDKPKGEIVVELDGGLVQAVRGTGNLVGMTYTVVDFDTDGSDPDDDKMDSVTYRDGSGADAFIHSDEILEMKFTID